MRPLFLDPNLCKEIHLVEMSNSIASNRSALKDFISSIAVIQGDLSNITAPPFVLGEYSTVELPQYWADHPSLFVAPTQGKDEAERALLVLKWFLGSLRNQQYAGRSEEDGVKKPLNAFLGELFIGSWNDETAGETRLVSEQVSHHPPITACYLWNDKYGIRAEGFTQQEITFSGSVSIKQKGYAILHIDKYDEDYLIPVPNVKVKGVLTGTPYPELVSNYSIISSNGTVSEIKFEGKSLLGLGKGSKNGFEARVYRQSAPNDDLYTVKGSWNGTFSIHSGSGHEIEHYDANAQRSIPAAVADRSEQDPWESRRAWGGVIDALGRGDMKGTAEAKSKVEEGQRQMRRDEEAQGKHWETVFFRRHKTDPIFDKLSAVDRSSYTVDPEGGIWKVDSDAVAQKKKPYHDGLLPTGQITDDEHAPHTNGVDNSLSREEPVAMGQQLNSEQTSVSHDSREPSNGVEQVRPVETGTLMDQKAEVGGDDQVDEIPASVLEAALRAKYQSAPR